MDPYNQAIINLSDAVNKAIDDYLNNHYVNFALLIGLLETKKGAVLSLIHHQETDLLFRHLNETPRYIN